MKTVISIEKLGPGAVCDLTVVDAEHYVLDNGLVSHNTGSYYGSDNIFIIGRQQEKDGTELTGYNFIINVEKSRYVKEKSKIPVTVSFDGGVSKWSGLFDIAIESGHLIKPKVGWYQRVNKETGEIEPKNWREKDTDSADFWMPILKDKLFRDFVKDKYQLAASSVMSDEAMDDSINEMIGAQDE